MAPFLLSSPNDLGEECICTGRLGTAQLLGLWNRVGPSFQLPGWLLLLQDVAFRTATTGSPALPSGAICVPLWCWLRHVGHAVSRPWTDVEHHWVFPGHANGLLWVRGTLPGNGATWLHLIFTLTEPSRHLYAHFTNEEPEAKRSWTGSQCRAELGLTPRCVAVPTLCCNPDSTAASKITNAISFPT